MMNKLVKTIDLLDVIKEFLNAYNWYYKLTPKELEVLEMLIEIDRSFDKDIQEYKTIISTENRKRIMKTLKIRPDNLCRYINNMKDKGIIVEGVRDEEFYINKNVIPQIIGDRLQLTIVFKIKK